MVSLLEQEALVEDEELVLQKICVEIRKIELILQLSSANCQPIATKTDLGVASVCSTAGQVAVLVCSKAGQVAASVCSKADRNFSRKLFRSG